MVLSYCFPLQLVLHAVAIISCENHPTFLKQLFIYESPYEDNLFSIVYYEMEKHFWKYGRRNNDALNHAAMQPTCTQMHC